MLRCACWWWVRVGIGEVGSNWLIMHSLWADISSLMSSSLVRENSVQSQEDITQGSLLCVCVRVFCMFGFMLSCASSSDQSLSITWSTCLSPFMVAHGACHALFIGHKREPQQLPHVSQSKQKRKNYSVTFKITRILTSSNTVTQIDLSFTGCH